MHRSLRTIGLATALLAVAAYPVVAGAAPAQPGAAAPGYVRTNLVSDRPGVAELTDPNLVNAWGLAHGPDTPIWVSDNGADVSDALQGTRSAGTPVCDGAARRRHARRRTDRSGLQRHVRASSCQGRPHRRCSSSPARTVT